MLINQFVRPRRTTVHRVNRLYGDVIRPLFPLADIERYVQVGSHIPVIEAAAATIGIGFREVDIVQARSRTDTQGVGQINR